MIIYRQYHQDAHLHDKALMAQVEEEVKDTQAWRIQSGQPLLTAAEVARYREIWIKFYLYLEEPGERK